MKRIALIAVAIIIFVFVFIDNSHSSEYEPTTDWSAYQYSKEYYKQKDADYQFRRKQEKYMKQNEE